MLKNNKKIGASVIIVTFNSSKVIKSCLSSIVEKTKDIEYEIIVVDNASQDETLKIVNSNFGSIDNLKIIKLEKNIGYGRALNIGTKRAKYEFLIFLNPDITLYNDTVSILIREIVKRPLISIAAPLLYEKNGKIALTVWKNFPSPINLLFEYSLINAILKQIKVKNFPFFIYSYDPLKEKEIKAVSGAFIAIRKKDFNSVGGFDKKFFLFYDETDLCRQIFKKGGKIALIKDARAIHLGGASSNLKKESILEASLESMCYYLKKYYSPQEIMFFNFGFRIISFINYYLLKLVSKIIKLPPNLNQRMEGYKFCLKYFSAKSK